MPKILHISDLHFGWPAVPEQADAVEETAQTEKFDIIALSGDLAQRARAGEFQRARVFMRDVRRPRMTNATPPDLVVVPGNHDVAWWFAPLGLGQRWRVYEKYRRYINETLEPVLRSHGTMIVGLNTAAGVDWHTLTWNPRDVSVKGALRQSQIDWAGEQFKSAAPGEMRIIVMHHNPLRGELSQRHGLLRSRQALDAFGRMGVELVLCGHDHQVSVDFVEQAAPEGGSGKHGIVVSTAGTLSSRSRGGHPSSYNVVTITDKTIEVEVRSWSASARSFEPAGERCFER